MSCQPASPLSHHVAPIIGYHHAPLSQKFGAPRQPNLVALTSVIEMIEPYNTPAAVVGLEEFSHIWISWQFHHNYLHKDKQANKADSSFRAQVRPPRRIQPVLNRQPQHQFAQHLVKLFFLGEKI